MIPNRLDMSTVVKGNSIDKKSFLENSLLCSNGGRAISESDSESEDSEAQTFDECRDWLKDEIPDDVTVGNLPSNEADKPGMSYIALISMAIQSHPEKRMLLSEIYSWISENFPYYQLKDKSWRNSIRHNLSLNECFIKCGRSENGKGNYWSIHPANIDDFSNGDFRRRRARRRVRKCDEDLQRLCSVAFDIPADQPKFKSDTQTPDGYVPMMTIVVPTSVLISTFGAEMVLSKEELERFSEHPNYDSVMTSQSQFPCQPNGHQHMQPALSNSSSIDGIATTPATTWDNTFLQSNQYYK